MRITDCLYDGHSGLTTNTPSLSKQDVTKAFTAHNFSYDEVREALKNIGDASGRVDVEEFAELYAKLKEGTGSAATSQSKAGQVKLGGSTASSSHTVNDDERIEFTRFVLKE